MPRGTKTVLVDPDSKPSAVEELAKNINDYFISNASSSTRLKTLVWLSGLRWAVEQCFEETQTELSMNHCEVRKFTGWQHHMLTCMPAHFRGATL